MVGFVQGEVGAGKDLMRIARGSVAHGKHGAVGGTKVSGLANLMHWEPLRGFYNLRMTEDLRLEISEHQSDVRCLHGLVNK